MRSVPVKQHYLHVYTGTGKGKTTAAMGLALRAAGHEQRVLIVQWMKDGTSGELSALRLLPTVTVYPALPMRQFTYQMDEETLTKTRIEQTAQVLAVTKLVLSSTPQLMIFDELAAALSTGLVKEDAVRSLIVTALQYGEVVITGYEAPAWLVDQADYVSNMQAVRHPYQTEGLSAREGVEW